MTRRNALRTANRAISNARSIKLATQGSDYASKTTKWVKEAKLLENEVNKLKLKFTASSTGYDAKSLSHINDINNTVNPLTLEQKTTRKNEIGDIHSKALDDIKKAEEIRDLVDSSLNQIIDWDNLMEEQLDSWTGTQADKTSLEGYQNTVQDNRVEQLKEKNDIDALIISIKDIFDNRIDVRYVNAQIKIGQAQAAGTSLTLTADGTFLASWDNIQGDLKESWKNINHTVDSKLFKFSRNNNTSSSDLIQRRRRLSQMKTLNTRNNNFTNRNFSMLNGVIKKMNSHSDLVNMKLASNLIDKNCRNLSNLANNLKDSIITHEDLSANIRLDGGGGGLDGYQTNFPVDGKRSSIGLLSKPSERDEVKKSVLFSLKNNIKKIEQINCEQPNKMNKVQISEPHKNIHPKEIHNHYFPIAGKAYGQYNHRHSSHPHGSSGVPKHYFQHFAFRFAKNPRNINEA